MAEFAIDSKLLRSAFIRLFYNKNMDKWANFISWLRIERSLVVVVFRHVTVEVNGDVLVLSGGLVDEEEVGLLSIAENITKNA